MCFCSQAKTWVPPSFVMRYEPIQSVDKTISIPGGIDISTAGAVAFVAGPPGNYQGPEPCQLPFKLNLHGAAPDVDARGSRCTDGRRHKLFCALGKSLSSTPRISFMSWACSQEIWREVKTDLGPGNSTSLL